MTYPFVGTNLYTFGPDRERLLAVGEQWEVAAKRYAAQDVQPEVLRDADVSSSDPTVVTVVRDRRGSVLVAKRPGRVTITTRHGSLTRADPVQVVAPSSPVSLAFGFYPSPRGLAALRLTARCPALKAGDSVPHAFEIARYPDVRWSISDPTRARLSSGDVATLELLRDGPLGLAATYQDSTATLACEIVDGVLYRIDVVVPCAFFAIGTWLMILARRLGSDGSSVPLDTPENFAITPPGLVNGCEPWEGGVALRRGGNGAGTLTARWRGARTEVALDTLDASRISLGLYVSSVLCDPGETLRLQAQWTTPQRAYAANPLDDIQWNIPSAFTIVQRDNAEAEVTVTGTGSAYVEIRFGPYVAKQVVTIRDPANPSGDMNWY